MFLFLISNFKYVLRIHGLAIHYENVCTHIFKLQEIKHYFHKNVYVPVING